MGLVTNINKKYFNGQSQMSKWNLKYFMVLSSFTYNKSIFSFFFVSFHLLVRCFSTQQLYFLPVPFSDCTNLVFHFPIFFLFLYFHPIPYLLFFSLFFLASIKFVVKGGVLWLTWAVNWCSVVGWRYVGSELPTT